MGIPGGVEIFVIIILLGLIIVPIILHIKQERVILKHKESGVIKKVPFLYSWISLVFGFFVPLFRGDIKWFFIYFIFFALSLLIPLFGLANFILAFFINKQYIIKLIQNEYESTDERSKDLLISKNIILNN